MPVERLQSFLAICRDVYLSSILQLFPNHGAAAKDSDETICQVDL